MAGSPFILDGWTSSTEINDGNIPVHLMITVLITAEDFITNMTAFILFRPRIFSKISSK